MPWRSRAAAGARPCGPIRPSRPDSTCTRERLPASRLPRRMACPGRRWRRCSADQRGERCPPLPRSRSGRARTGSPHAGGLPPRPGALRGDPGRPRQAGTRRGDDAGRCRLPGRPARGRRRAPAAGSELGGGAGRGGSRSARVPAALGGVSRAPPPGLPREISVPEVERLLAAAGGQAPAQLRDRALLELLYGTGARISEAVGLDVDDLDLAAEGRAASVPVAVRLSGKGGKQRIVPVGSYARAALEAYLIRARPVLAAAGHLCTASHAVFLNARGGRLTRQGAWGALRGAAARADLPPVSPHTLRHCFATHLIDGGADVRVVQELLGHASVTTTQVYTLVTVDKLREVYAAAHPRALG